MRLPCETAAMPTALDRPIVLVAEDGDGTRQLSCLVLESAGFVCREAGSVEAALAMLGDGSRIDIVFSDIHFPGGRSGVDLAQRALAGSPPIPVLMTSGLAVEYVEDVLPERVAFLEKPYTPDQLVAAINSVLGRRTRSRTPATA